MSVGALSYYTTPYHITKEYVNVCVRVYMCVSHVDAEGSWMPWLHLKDDLYVHNEVHTHV